MASLTPGVLSKLLQNAGNKDYRVTGKHRNPLLQVIEIVPSFVGENDDPLHLHSSSGFFVKVSDSLHSAYVSISDEDVDLIYSDKIQLGQFVHVSHLDSSSSGSRSSPVPVLRGIKPLPRRRPCVGNPKDLVSSDLLSPVRKSFDFSKNASKNNGLLGVSKNASVNAKNNGLLGLSKNASVNVIANAKNNGLLGLSTNANANAKNNGLLGVSKNASVNAKRLVSDEAKSRRASFGEDRGRRVVGSGGLELRRLSLDSTRKAWDNQCPTPKTPNTARSASSLRFKSSKESSSASSASSLPNPSVVSDKKAYPRKDSLLLNRPNMTTISPLKPKNETFPLNSNNRHLKKEQLKSSFGGTTPSHLTELPLNLRTWFKQKTCWDLLPPTIHELGKGAVSRRNVAFLAAVDALEEASAAEGVIHCMRENDGVVAHMLLCGCTRGFTVASVEPSDQMMPEALHFLELCESSHNDSPGPLVEKFLNLYQSMQKVAMDIAAIKYTSSTDAEASTCGSRSLSSETYKKLSNKDATSWVQAAVETNLSKFCLFKMQGKREILKGEKCHYVVLENTPNETMSVDHSPQNKNSSRFDHGRFLSDGSARSQKSPSQRCLSATKRMNTERDVWSKGTGLKEAAKLAGKLLLVSHGWFLKYLEDSLDNGFGLRGEEGKVEIACLLGQLKRVNQWLDDSAGDENELVERIQGLKKKLYGFLLEHADSTIFASK